MVWVEGWVRLEECVCVCAACVSSAPNVTKVYV